MRVGSDLIRGLLVYESWRWLLVRLVITALAIASLLLSCGGAK